MLSWTDFEHVLTLEIHQLCTMTVAVPQCAIGFMPPTVNTDFFHKYFNVVGIWEINDDLILSSALTQVSHHSALFSFGSGRHYSRNHENARQVKHGQKH